MNEVAVGKIFTFDAAHQLVGHRGKCANLHGHTYKLEVVLKGPVIRESGVSSEGFVMDFHDVKRIVKERIVDLWDHSFLAMGNEAVLETLYQSNSKVALLGFRTTAENLSSYICYALKQAGLPVYSVKLWETPTAWAEVLSSEIPEQGPSYRPHGGCDIE